MKTTLKVMLPIIVCVLIFDYDLASIAEGTENTALARSILDRMVENRNKVENFQCVNEKFISFPTDILSKLNLKVEEDRPEEEAKERTYRYHIDNLALDNKGCGRVTLIVEEADAKGHRMGKGKRKITTTWDGENSIRYSESSMRSSAIIGGTKQPLEVTKRYAQPWTVFGGEFCDDLTRALEQNEKIKIEKQEDGNYRIEILRSQDRKIIGVIDPNQGYSMVLRERYLKGKLHEREKARFEQVKPGIWFPVRGDYSYGITTGADVRSTMTIKEIEINDPNFYDGLYQVDFAEGTYVENIARGLSHISMERPPLLIGKPLPELKDLNVDLLPADTAGKRILVCFLDIEQRPSRNCLQQLNARAQELEAKGIKIIAVHASKIDESRLEEWRREHQVSFPFGRVQGDEDEVFSTWGIYSLPWLILTDGRHVVVVEGFGLSELDAKIKEIDGD